MDGWNHVLQHRCKKSELSDAKKVNYQSEFSSETKDSANMKGIYVYQAMVKPGFHQFVIYCPKNNRAFCKEIVIDLNNNYVDCPELPRSFKHKRSQKKRVLNVWLAWKSDTEEQKRKAVQWDAMTEDFQLELFIRDRRNEDIVNQTRGAIMAAIEKAFDWINILQKESQATSQQYPEIDFLNFY